MAENAITQKFHATENYVALHVHSDGSVLDGFSTIPDIVNRTIELGQPAVAVTDHGSLFNIYELYKQATAAGVKPILGLEAYMAPSPISHTIHEPYFFSDGGSDDVSAKGAYTHITLWAYNNIGLKNLFKLSYLSYAEGYYKKPRISVDLLKKYHEGLIGSTGCPSGEIQTLIRLGEYDRALEHAKTMQTIFGKDYYYMELMDHQMKNDLERKVMDDLLKIHNVLNIPLLATNDSHYTRSTDAPYHEKMLCISTHSKMNVPTSREEEEGGKTRFAFDGQGYYLKTEQEMRQLFPEDKYPEAISNTVKLANMCNVTITPHEGLRPQIDLPEGETEATWLKKEAYKGLAKRLPDHANDPKYVQRLETELNVIIPKDYSNYFLVVSDFVRWAKNHNVPTGYGRGSAAGSLLAYVLDITDADPIRDDLLFERFLNPERDSPPDIDMDFNDADREKVIDYVKNKYGEDHVTQVVTFGKIQAKNAVKDMVRILDEPYSLGDELTKAMPEAVFGKSMSLKDMYNPESKRYSEAAGFRQLVTERGAEEIVDGALHLEGRIRSTGVHACALIISSQPVVKNVPVMVRQSDRALITQWDYPTAESLGLLKMDFLGLRNLGIINDTVQLIKKRRNIEINPQNLIQGTRDDEKTYELLRDGNTLAVFQLDGCLDGNTFLTNGMTIAQYYNAFHKGEGVSKTLTSYDLDAGKIRHNKVLNVIQSGIKPVYRLATEQGKFIEATADHKFMTNNGWKKLGDIDPLKDEVLVSQVGNFGRLCAHCNQPLNRKTPDSPWKKGQLCYTCSAVFHSNPSIPSCSRFEKIISIDFVGDRMTYDISMNDPYNNFIANGFIVHNSGMRNLLKLLKPTSFNDISAVLSLYRPGPMGVNAHIDYALRKNGLQEAKPIHPEFSESLKDVLNPTYNLVVYQEQVMQIAQIVAGYSLGHADLLRRAMGKKKRYIIDAEFVPFRDGARANGYSDEAIQALWDILVPFSDYAFNKCISQRTKIRTSDNLPVEASQLLKDFKDGKEIWLQSMWADGEVRPHKVKNIVSTGVKPIFRVKTRSGRTVEVTADHRLMTTRGYIKTEEMIVGKDELIVAPKIITPEQSRTVMENIKKAHWIKDNPEEWKRVNARAAERLKKYQSTLTFDDRSRHQKYVNQITDRGVRQAELMRHAKAKKYEEDPIFRQQVLDHLASNRKKQIENGQHFGVPAIASNGMYCESQNELYMAEFLIEKGIEFEMHKQVGLGWCDFYFNGIYWEMDDMDRDIAYFDRKYGDIPYVVVYPEDFKYKINLELQKEHVTNGDLIISIEPVQKKLSTLDIEMEDNGPKNYLTWEGVVSHNSHTVGYGLLSYVTAYLKAHYPAEYMSSVLSSVADDVDKTALYLEDCRDNGITVVPPDVSRSVANYYPSGDKEILFGLKAIRGIGESVADEIVKARDDIQPDGSIKNKKFTDFNDFMNRVSSTVINKRVLEGLTYGGAFDSMGLSRKGLIYQIPDFVKKYQKVNKKQKDDIVSLFDMTDIISYDPLPMKEYPRLEKLKLERKVLGLYVSEHPIDGLNLTNMATARISQLTSKSIKPLEGWPSPRDVPVRIAGIVTSLQIRRNKKGEPFAIAKLEDRSGSIECMIFPKTYDKVGKFVKLDGVYQFTGFSRTREEEVNFIVDNARPLDFSDSGNLTIRIKVTESQWNAGKETFLNILSKHLAPNNETPDSLIVSIKDQNNKVWEEQLDTPIRRSTALIQRIQELFGSRCIGRWKVLRDTEA